MKYLILIPLVLIAVVVVGFGVLLLFLQIYDNFIQRRFWRLIDQQQQTEMAHFNENLQKPDWPIFRKHLKREAPEILKQAYADVAFISKTHHLDGQPLHFLPIQKRSVPEHLPFLNNYFSFAELDEDPVFLKPGQDEHNAVYRLPGNDDPDDLFEELSPSIEEFMGKLGFAVEQTQNTGNARPALNRRK